VKALVSILAAAFLAACTCSGAGPTAGGATPYVRCAMREPAAIDTTVGALHLHTTERTLVIDGASSPLRVAAFRGAALADEPIEPALDAIEAGSPAIAILLGSIGDDEAHATTLLTALASLSIPTLVVLGGRDHPADLDAAIASLPTEARTHVIDASAFRIVRVGGVELVPVAGAPDGRYARDDEACGLGASDADAIASDVGAAGELPRVLVSFAGPSPLAGIEGGEAGSAPVADLASRVGAAHDLHAWPDAPSPSLVPPLAGPPAALADGSRLEPGVLLVDVGPSGIAPVSLP
jgi:hypothetical protein